MRPTTAARIALALGSANQSSNFFGIPTILSGNSPQQVVLADLSQVLYADEGGFDVASSQEATPPVAALQPTRAGRYEPSICTSTTCGTRPDPGCWNPAGPCITSRRCSDMPT